MIGDFNRRITFKSWGATQDPGGGAIALLLASYTIWAKVEPRNGQLFSSKQQALWSYDYKITFRYEKSRPVRSNYTIDYDGKRLSINSVSFVDEGNRKYAVARCSTIDAAVDTSGDIIASLHTFDYYGIGGEDNFNADGTPLGLPKTVPVDIRNKTIVGAYKDGENFNVILALPFDPVVKQVLYTPSTGNFLWSIPFETDEHALIQFF